MEKLHTHDAKHSTLYNARNLVFFLSYLINILIFFIPGMKDIIETPDARSQYAQALSGIYSDHSPVMMAFVWHYLNYIYEGFFLMYLLQTTLLFAGLFFIWKASEHFIDFEKKYILLLLIFLFPFIPQIFVYSVSVQKDNPFTYTFLAVAGILSLYTLNNKRISIPMLISIIILLIYGTGVKYQAQFVLPIMTIWLGILIKQNSSSVSKFLHGILLTLLVYSGTYIISETVVSKQGKDNAWQYVKLFDLAAISIDLDHDLIPTSNKTDAYTFSFIKNNFQKNAIDPYIYIPEPVLKRASTIEERNALWETWFKAVKDHPILYMKHRLTNFTYCLLGRAGYSLIEKQTSKFLTTDSLSHKLLRNAITVASYVFLIQISFFLIGAFYLYIGLSNWKTSKLARILVAFNSMALLLASVIVFMSMAGTPRYTFFSIVMINASHLFAIGLYQEKKKKDMLMKTQ